MDMRMRRGWTLWVSALGLLLCGPTLPPHLEEIAYPRRLFPKGSAAVPENFSEIIWQLPLGGLGADIRKSGLLELTAPASPRLGAQCRMAKHILEPFWVAELLPERPHTLDEVRRTPWTLWTLPDLKPMARPFVRKDAFSWGIPYEGLLALLSSPGEFGLSVNDAPDGVNHWFLSVCVSDKGYPLKKLIKESHMRASPGWIRELKTTPERVFFWRYWHAITDQLGYAGMGYIKMTGRIPRTVEDLEKVAGKRNLEAWNPVIEATVKEFLKWLAESPHYADKK